MTEWDNVTTPKFVSEYQTNSLKDENSLYQQGEGVKKYKAMMHYLQYGNAVAFEDLCPTIKLA
jgi:hypothetical protein